MSATTSSTATSASASASATATDSSGSGSAQSSTGISVVAFFTALSTSLVIFGIQTGFFLLLRNKLARIYKPKTYLVPERERTDPPPESPWGLIGCVLRHNDRDIIKKCGLDAYFFLRYLQTLLLIFIPIALIAIPILVPINYVDGIGQSFGSKDANATNSNVPTGLDTIAWGNVKPSNSNRRWAHLILAICVIVWVCFVFFWELRTYIKIRQDYLTSAEHRMRASANTVLVSGIPSKWLTEEALRGLFDVFPGGIRNIWLTRDYTKLLEKVQKRDKIHQQLEGAETQLIRNAKTVQMKKQAAEEKKVRKEFQATPVSKAEREQRKREEDDRARQMAEGAGGISAGDQEVPQIDGMQDDDGSSRSGASSISKEQSAGQKRSRKVPVIGAGISMVGHGVKGGAKAVHRGVDNQVEQSNGFGFIKSGPVASGPSSQPTTGDPESEPSTPRRVGIRIVSDPKGHQSKLSDSSLLSRPDPGNQGNTTRRVTDWDKINVTEDARWWKFWRPPNGGYPSPVPQGYEGDEFPFDGTADIAKNEKPKKSLGAQILSFIPFMGGSDEEPIDYPETQNPDFTTDEKEEESATWTKYLKESERPSHRLPWFGFTPGWLPGFPFLHKKVDTIYYCRKELARLNMEIEEDQQMPERYPIMNSAFIQFNNQVAAHMACQSITHHVPKQMAPRIVEVSPDDVIWGNMAIRWWDEWLRTFLAISVVFGMTILWAFPVAFTSSLSQIDSLVKSYQWLGWIKSNPVVYDVAKAVAGVLPALLLSLLLILVPIILNLLAGFQGSKTGSQKAEYVQTYYFFFLFVQVFLVVSIASGTIATLQDTIKDVQGVPSVLAKNLPKASNYFFSYMILQALSTSSGTLLQIGTLFVWYILARMLDNTARNKWKRQTSLPSISWGPFFPVYTNFACIALVYAVIAPLISLFAIITFGLLWFAHRYNMIYVTSFKIDTGGVLYPRAINQTFTGLYFMELCLIGLFFLVTNEHGDVACAPQAIIMIVVLVMTVLYQVLLNRSFGPMLRYLPITFEDEAVLRDEAFQRAQSRRLGLAVDDDEFDYDEAATLTGADSRATAGAGASGNGTDVELKKLGTNGRQRSNKLNPVRGIAHAGSWAVKGGTKVRKAALGRAEANMRNAADFRRERRQKDLEAQRAIGDALYGGFHDEIEDLTPDERDKLVQEAFKHSALRAHRPTVWIPRDDLGVSDDEIRHTCNLSDYIWISNEGTALDSKVRVVYGRAPPDFSDIQLINL